MLKIFEENELKKKISNNDILLLLDLFKNLENDIINGNNTINYITNYYYPILNDN